MSEKRRYHRKSFETDSLPDDHQEVPDQLDISGNDIAELTQEYSERIYLQDLLKTQPLTEEEEITIFKLLNTYDTNILQVRYGEFSEENDYGAIDIVEQLRKKTRDDIVLANIRLVIWVLKEYLGRDLPFFDLFQYGITGLIRAIDRFDLGQNTKFSTYAVYWIRQAISVEVKKARVPGKLNPRERDEFYRFLAIFNAGVDYFDRDPTLEEMMLAMPEVKEKRLRTYFQLRKRPKELIEEIEAPESHNTDDHTETRSISVLRDALIFLSPVLNQRQLQVITYRYGLDDGVLRTRKNVAELLGISSSVVSNIELPITNFLRENLRFDEDGNISEDIREKWLKTTRRKSHYLKHSAQRVMYTSWSNLTNALLGKSPDSTTRVGDFDSATNIVPENRDKPRSYDSAPEQEIIPTNQEKEWFDKQPQYITSTHIRVIPFARLIESIANYGLPKVRAQVIRILEKMGVEELYSAHHLALEFTPHLPKPYPANVMFISITDAIKVMRHKAIRDKFVF